MLLSHFKCVTAYTSTVLFAGAGLMDYAIATTGGRVTTAIEWDDRIAAQYAYNFPYVRLLAQSVQSVNPEELDVTDHWVIVSAIRN
jgi:site-specific DNA-cytosine methylase